MKVSIREEPTAALKELARVSIAFEVDRILEVSELGEGLGGIALTEKRVSPYTVDHDARAGAGPERWAERFDVSRWGLLSAKDGVTHVGGAVIAFDTPDLFMLDGRRDVAALWDLRVQPDRRGMGVGRDLLEAAAAWATARGCRRMKIETQNVNVAACEFYVRQGCVLGSIERYAYDDWAPDEVRLVYVKELPRASATSTAG